LLSSGQFLDSGADKSWQMNVSSRSSTQLGREFQVVIRVPPSESEHGAAADGRQRGKELGIQSSSACVTLVQHARSCQRSPEGLRMKAFESIRCRVSRRWRVLCVRQTVQHNPPALQALRETVVYPVCQVAALCVECFLSTFALEPFSHIGRNSNLDAHALKAGNDDLQQPRSLQALYGVETKTDRRWRAEPFEARRVLQRFTPERLGLFRDDDS
jgi:hypothetical protein